MMLGSQKKKGQINMKTLYLKDDIQVFLKEIGEYLPYEDVQISMYGYNAVVYRGSSMNSVRQDIQRKLKAIQNCEANISSLRKYSNMTEDEIASLTIHSTPEEIADICLELGIIGSSKSI